MAKTGFLMTWLMHMDAIQKVIICKWVTWRSKKAFVCHENSKAKVEFPSAELGLGLPEKQLHVGLCFPKKALVCPKMLNGIDLP